MSTNAHPSSASLFPLPFALDIWACKVGLFGRENISFNQLLYQSVPIFALQTLPVKASFRMLLFLSEVLLPGIKLAHSTLTNHSRSRGVV